MIRRYFLLHEAKTKKYLCSGIITRKKKEGRSVETFLYFEIFFQLKCKQFSTIISFFIVNDSKIASKSLKNLRVGAKM